MSPFVTFFSLPVFRPPAPRVLLPRRGQMCGNYRLLRQSYGVRPRSKGNSVLSLLSVVEPTCNPLWGSSFPYAPLLLGTHRLVEETVRTQSEFLLEGFESRPKTGMSPPDRGVSTETRTPSRRSLLLRLSVTRPSSFLKTLTPTARSQVETEKSLFRTDNDFPLFYFLITGDPDWVLLGQEVGSVGFNDCGLCSESYVKYEFYGRHV